MDVKKELGRNDFTVTVPSERRFVEFRLSSQEAFSRFETVKKAQDILKKSIADTGGNMTRELINAYEGLNSVMEHIKELELDIVKLGR